MKKIFSFIALAFLSVSAFAQTCVETDVNLTGTASITFTRYEHKNLTGLFSVAAGKQVLFSQGNLQYQASTNTWRFAEHQWDKADGNSTASGRDTQSKWIDLFGYGTSGWDNGSERYMPYDNEKTAENYTANHLYSSVEADWAWHNVIINGGVSMEGPVNHIWRVMTKEEWEYLIARSERTLIGIGTLKGVEGLFILPDDWDWSETTIAAAATAYNNFEFVSANASLSAYTINIIDNSSEGSAFWDVLENAGVVFLPCEGYRVESAIYTPTRGYYWMATNSDSNLSGVLQFYETVCGYGRKSRAEGCAVRPVREL